MKNQKGFTLVEGLLIVIALSLVSFVGFYVYKANDKKENTSPQITSESQKSDTDSPDSTKDWKEFKSTDGKYSLKYPVFWVTPTNSEDCMPGLLLLAADSSSLGACGSENGGHMTVYSTIEGAQKDYELTPENYSDLKNEKVTVSGVTGIRQSGTFSGEDMGIGPQKGEKEVLYIFTKDKRIYAASYRFSRGDTTYPNVLNDFDLMVTKTLKFND
jgi:hypothetical protein